MSFFVVGMIYSLFFLYRILGQQLLFKGKHRDVNCTNFTVTCIENFASKVWSVRSLGRKKKVQDCDYVFESSTTFQRKKEWICESRCRQVGDRLHVFARFFLPLNLSTTTIYARSAFYPSLRFTLSLQSAVCIYPWSAVRSPQSAVRSLQSPVRSPQSALRSPQSSSYTDRCFIDS